MIVCDFPIRPAMVRLKTSELAEQKEVSVHCLDPKGGSLPVMNFIFTLEKKEESMRHTLYSIILIILLCTVTASAGNADTADVKAFFKKFVELSDAYDVKVADLYSDEAKIRTYRRYPHGLKRAMELTGAQWKELIKRVMPLAKMKGDRSTYTNIKISFNGAKAKIKADRYSVSKCYTDTGYYMILERQTDGRYMIIEEYTETQPQSDC